MRQSLVTRKNRKLRKVRGSIRTSSVKLFYRRDIERLAQRYRLQARAVVSRSDELRAGHPSARSTSRATRSPTRVAELGARDRRATTRAASPLLVAPLKSSAVFLADLSRALPIPHELDFVELAPLLRRGDGGAACGS